MDQDLIEAFEEAGLPEINESRLEPGTYTNAQMAEKMAGHIPELKAFLRQLDQHGSPAANRSTLSMAINLFVPDS